MPPIVMISQSRMPNDQLRAEAVLSVFAGDQRTGEGLLITETVFIDKLSQRIRGNTGLASDQQDGSQSK